MNNTSLLLLIFLSIFIISCDATNGIEIKNLRSDTILVSTGRNFFIDTISMNVNKNIAIVYKSDMPYAKLGSAQKLCLGITIGEIDSNEANYDSLIVLSDHEDTLEKIIGTDNILTRFKNDSENIKYIIHIK